MPSRKSNKSKKKKAAAAEQPGLRALVQQRILTDVFQFASETWPDWMVLIVDKYAMKVLSTAVGMYDIMERRITLVEDITKKRASFKDMAAVYLLAPTDDSVNRLIADYDGEKVLYGKAAFVYFLGRIPEKQLEKIKNCKRLGRRLKALSEANVDFLAKESRAFSFDMKRAFSDVYVRKGRSKIESKMAEKLISVCSTLNELPHVRYANDSPTALALAKTFTVKMENFARNNTNFWYHGDNNNNGKERATLLILDRRDDCLSPLMHDFTYQAMVNDLLSIDDEKITLVSENHAADDVGAYDDDDEDEEGGEGEEEAEVDDSNKQVKDILLNEHDHVWVELRGKHIAVVISTLSDRCREMVNSDTSGFTNKDKGKTMSLSQMASALKALPEYREVMAKLSQHMQIAHQCMDKFTNGGLLELSELEQTLATGVTEDGNKPGLNDLVKQVTEELKKTKSVTARLRLLLILIISQRGVRAEDKDALWEAASVAEEEQKLLDNIHNHLEVPIVKGDEGSSGGGGGGFKLFGSKVQSSGDYDADAEFANSRYVPPLKHILEEIVQNRLSMEDYPSVNPMPEMHGTGSGAAHSARKRPDGSARRGGATSRWQRSIPAEKTKEESYQGGRVIVFMVGGMCFSELRVAREVMAKESKEIIAGSTTWLKPKQFIDHIRRL